MAGIAFKYEEYIDHGVAVSEEALEAWTPEQWAQQRIEDLLAMYQVLLRRQQMNLEWPEWWGKATRSMKGRITWYCAKAHIDPMQWPVLTEGLEVLPKSAEGKKLAAAVLALKSDNFLGAWAAEAEHQRTVLATYADKKSKQKRFWSYVNPLINCCDAELSVINKLDLERSGMMKTADV